MSDLPPAQKAHIKFHYEISSPYSYIAFTTLHRYQKIWNLEIELCPIFMGSVIEHTGNPPPLKNRQRAPYLDLDLETVSERWGLDTRSPPGHPEKTSTLNTIRLLRVVKEREDPQVLYECTRLLYWEFYSVQTPWNAPNFGFFDCLIPVLGRPKLEKYVGISLTSENKAALREDGRNAVERYGMFGVPHIVVTRPSDRKVDIFFGQDKVEAIGWFLGPEYKWNGPWPSGDDPLPVSEPRRPSLSRL